jgi:hypothetical protein
MVALLASLLAANLHLSWNSVSSGKLCYVPPSHRRVPLCNQVATPASYVTDRQSDTKSYFFEYLRFLVPMTPTTVAARSKAWHVFARSNTGIVGSNHTEGMDVCVCIR